VPGQAVSSEFDDIELSLMEARVKSLRNKGADSAYGLIGNELRPFIGDPESSPLPESFKAALQQSLARRDGWHEEFRAGSASDDKIGKRFWEIYRSQLRTSLCDTNGDLYKLLASEGQTSTKAVISGLIATLGLGTLFAGVICGLAAIILEIGLRAFCEWTENPAQHRGDTRP
jgi:hypothetical protein